MIRSELHQRLLASDWARLITIVAPAGYGKTTALSQWLEDEPRPNVWLTVRRDHNDPAQLLRDIRDGLVQAELLSREAGARLSFTSSTALSQGVRSIVQALDDPPPSVLVLDQVQTMQSTPAKDALTELTVRLPAGVTLVMASRSAIPIPISTLRPQGELLELVAEDLTLSVAEAETLAKKLNVSVDDSELAAAVQRAEGWPAGLYLMLLAAKDGTPLADVTDMGGEGKFLAQYLRSVVLVNLTPSRRSLLLQISVLDEITGPACNFLLERSDCGSVITTLAEAGRFVEPIDLQGRRFRFHQLLHDFLQTELQSSDPNLWVRLNLRASTWYEDQDMPSEAIHHAIVADDPERAAHLVVTFAHRVFSEGRIDTVRGWIEWFENRKLLDTYPAIALMGSFVYSNLADQAAVDRWMTIVGGAGDDIAPVAPLVRLADSLFCRQGVARALIDAREAREALTPASLWYASAVGLEALALLWSGQTESAEERFVTAADVGERFGDAPTATFSLATLSMIAAQDGDQTRADELAARALRLAKEAQIEQYPTGVIAYVVSARRALRRGKLIEARHLLSQASIRRPILTSALPLISGQTLLEMAHAEIELADIAGARQISRELQAIVRDRSVGVLEQRCEEMKETLSILPAGRTGAATLTNAELRLLPYLATHLSFREIGERLYVSRYTIKTQASSVYRKMGASSRSEAVDLARDIHILDP